MKRNIKFIVTLLIVFGFAYFILPSGIKAMSADEAGKYIAQFSLNFAKAFGKDTYYTCANYMDNVNSPRAYAYRGKKYTMSSKQGSGEYYWLDCVGWVSMAIHGSLGIGDPYTFTIWAVPTQYQYINQNGFELLDFSEDKLKPGDILCNYYHVMVYCGNGKIVHCDGAGPGGTGVHEEKLRSYYGYKNITKIVRISEKIANSIDPSNATVLVEGEGTLGDMWSDSSSDGLTTSTGKGWIVDPNDKLELFKHILFTEKYNFNGIKWETYGHNVGSFTIGSASNSSAPSSTPTSSNSDDNKNAEINTQEGYRGTFTDSKLRTYKEYKQGFDPWKDIKYSQGNIASSGCGPTSLAIIASGYGISETPETIAKYMVGNTGPEKLKNALINKLKLNCTIVYGTKDEIAQKMRECLKNGRPVVLSVGNSPTKMFTGNSHIMAGLAINDKDEVWVSNPNSSTTNGWVSIDTVASHIMGQPGGSGASYIITIDQDTKGE